MRGGVGGRRPRRPKRCLAARHCTGQCAHVGTRIGLPAGSLWLVVARCGRSTRVRCARGSLRSRRVAAPQVANLASAALLRDRGWRQVFFVSGGVIASFTPVLALALPLLTPAAPRPKVFSRGRPALRARAKGSSPFSVSGAAAVAGSYALVKMARYCLMPDALVCLAPRKHLAASRAAPAPRPSPFALVAAQQSTRHRRPARRPTDRPTDLRPTDRPTAGSGCPSSSPSTAGSRHLSPRESLPRACEKGGDGG